MTAAPLLALQLALAIPDYGAHPSIRVIVDDSGAAGSCKGISAFLEMELASAVKRAFPCARVLTEREFDRLVREDRDKALSTDTLGHYDEIVQDNAANFAVQAKLDCKAGEVFWVGAKALSMNPPSVDARTGMDTMRWRSLEDQKTQIRSVVGEFIEDLSKHEICPYLGTVKFTHQRAFDHDYTRSGKAEEGGCSYRDAWNRHVEERRTWSLVKKGRRRADGELSYVDRTKTVSKYFESCARCLKIEGGVAVDTGQRLIPATTTKTFEGSYEVHALDPTRLAKIEVQFDEDGEHFHVRVAARSAPAEAKDEERVEWEWDCPGYGAPRKRPKIVVGMRQQLDQTFGPFPGKRTDAKLKGKLTFTHDAVDEEVDIPPLKYTWTETVEVDLAR